MRGSEFPIPKFAITNPQWVRNLDGLTLNETIIVIMIMSILVLFLFQFVGGGMEAYVKTKGQKTLYSDALMAMGLMLREIREAEVVVIPNEYTICVMNRQPDGKFVLFHQSRRTLFRTRNSDNLVLAQHVSSFTVTQYSGLITLDLTLSNEGQARLRSKVRPRNLENMLTADGRSLTADRSSDCGFGNADLAISDF